MIILPYTGTGQDHDLKVDLQGSWLNPSIHPVGFIFHRFLSLLVVPSNEWLRDTKLLISLLPDVLSFAAFTLKHFWTIVFILEIFVILFSIFDD